METRNTGRIALFAFLAWLLSLIGPIASLWMLLRGILRLLPGFVAGMVPGAAGEILADYALTVAAFAGGLYLFSLAIELFLSVTGGFTLFVGLSLLMPGLLLLIVFLISLRVALRGRYTSARILLILQFGLYSGSGLLCYLAISRVAGAIGIVAQPYSFAPYIVFGTSALACLLLVLAYLRIVRIIQGSE